MTNQDEESLLQPEEKRLSRLKLVCRISIIFDALICLVLLIQCALYDMKWRESLHHRVPGVLYHLYGPKPDAMAIVTFVILLNSVVAWKSLNNDNRLKFCK